MSRRLRIQFPAAIYHIMNRRVARAAPRQPAADGGFQPSPEKDITNLLAHDFFHRRDDVGGLVHDFFRERFEIVAVDQLDVETLLLRVGV
jgi:hypothetical protein